MKRRNFLKNLGLAAGVPIAFQGIPLQLLASHKPLKNLVHNSTNDNVLVRVHSQCLTGDIFGSYRCDCGEQLESALNMIEQEGKGVLVYLRQEGRGIGLSNKIRAYKLQDKGLDTVEANHYLGFPPDLREYGIGAQIIRECGVRKMRILTNNPRKIVGLEGYGLEVIGRVPIEFKSNAVNKKYLQTKRDKLGHFILNEE